MSKSLTAFLFMFCIASASVLWSQSSGVREIAKKQKQEKTQADSTDRNLSIVQTVEAPSEMAGSVGYLTCDHDGNIYVEAGDPYAADAIHKLNPKGERMASFQSDANPDLKIDLTRNFTLAPDGDVYQLVFPHEINRYVFVYKGDGAFKSSIKLQSGFPWQPSVLAVFRQGTMLVSGLEYDQDPKNPVMWPFAGIFAPDGTLLKEVKLEDDATLHDLAASGDSRVTSPTNSSANHAIEFSQMAPADDGNIYLMRWMNPAIFYAVSPGGEVVRRFTVDPGDASFHPVAMHLSGNRIAALFAQREREEEIIKVVDLEGHAVATYHSASAEGNSKKYGLGLAFACYSQSPERFTFLSAGDDNKMRLRIAEPR
jgi:hypothetical protein